MGVRRELETNYDFEIVDEFLDHYSMMVDILEPLMIDLEKRELFARSVDELFRIFHNIKSAAGFLKMEPMVRLATFVENALETMRSLPGPANKETVNWLLLVSDTFVQWQEDLKLDNDLSKINFSLLKLPDLETI
jgi:two-component system chemotaxis sensor kinase CheA